MSNHYKNKWFWVLVVAVTICIFWVGEYVYWEYGDFKPVIIHSITPTQDEVCAGQQLYYTVDLTRTMNVTCVINRELVDSYRIQYDPIDPTSTALGRRLVTARLYVPKNTDPNNWVARVKWTCYVGPKKRAIIVGVQTTPVKVIECGSSKGEKGDTGKAGKDGKDFWGKR